MATDESLGVARSQGAEKLQELLAGPGGKTVGGVGHDIGVNVLSKVKAKGETFGI